MIAKNGNISKLNRFLLSAATLISSTSAAYAGQADADPSQATPSAPEASLLSEGDIVVTAQRRTESLQKIPITINAVSGEALTRAGVDDSLALQAIIPGLVINTIGANSSIFLRGVGSRAANAGLEPSTATYQDDRYIAGSQGNLFELMDVERVEVVKGPQGVLFGRNATAGAIRVITKDVERDFTGYVQASYGNYNDYQLRGTVNLPLAENAGLRISAMTHQHDGYERNLVATGRARMNDKSVSAVRAKLKIEPSDTITLRLTLDASRQDDSNGLATVVLPPYNLSTLTAGGAITGRRQGEFASAITSNQRQRNFAGQFRADFDLGFADFASITTYADNSSAFPIDFDGTNVVATDVDKIRSGNQTFTQEVQLVSQGDGAIEWLVGANYYDNEAFFETTITTPTARITPNGHQTANTRVKTQSAS